MRILIASDKAAAIQKNIAQNAQKNMIFEYQPDILKLIDMLEVQEFSAYDQLVLILSGLDKWDSIQRESILNRYIAWAMKQDPSKQIFFLDTTKEYYMNIVTEIQGKTNIHYMEGRIRAADLPKVCAGSYHPGTEEPTPAQATISKDTSRRNQVKPNQVPTARKGGFSLFGRKKKETKPKDQEDFSQTPQPVKEEREEDFSQTPQPIEPTPEPVPESAPVSVPDEDELLFGNGFMDHTAQQEPKQDDLLLDMNTPLYQEPIANPTPVQDKPAFDIGDMDESTPMFNQPEPEPEPAPAPESILEPDLNSQSAGVGGFQSNPHSFSQQPTNEFVQKPQSPVPTIASAPVPAPSTEPVINKVAKRKPKKSSKGTFKRSMAVLVTGDRRQGVSSVCSNLAIAAARNGESVLVLDFDFIRRGQSINFPIQHDANDARYLTPLSIALRMPQSLDQYVVHYDDGLDYLGTSLYVADIENAMSVVDNSRIQRLIGTALSQYDIVFIDCPFDKVMEWDALVTSATRIVHVMNSDQNAIMNNVTLLDEDAFLDPSIFQMYVPRMGLVLNAAKPIKLYGIPVNADNILSVFMELTGDEDSYVDFDVLGEIPYIENYEGILASDKQPAETKYGSYYQNILQRLREV